MASIFLAAYTVSLLVSGRLIDKLGTRLGMALFVSFWSIANMATVLARSFASLAACSLSVGFGRGGQLAGLDQSRFGVVPGQPTRLCHRVLYDGRHRGRDVAPVLVVFSLPDATDGRRRLLVTGAAGLALGLAMAGALSLAAATGRAAAERRRRLIAWPAAEGRAAFGMGPLARRVGVSRDLALDARADAYRSRVVLLPILVCEIPLHGPRRESGVVGDDVGCFLGGRCGQPGRRFGLGMVDPPRQHAGGRTDADHVPLRLRGAALAAGCNTSYRGAALAVAMLVTLAHMAWLVNISAILVDVIPGRLVATAFGLVAAGSALGGVLMNQAVGELVTDYSYTHWFVIMAFLHPIAWLLLWVFAVGRSTSEQETEERQHEKENGCTFDGRWRLDWRCLLSCWRAIGLAMGASGEVTSEACTLRLIDDGSISVASPGCPTQTFRPAFTVLYRKDNPKIGMASGRWISKSLTGPCRAPVRTRNYFKAAKAITLTATKAHVAGDQIRWKFPSQPEFSLGQTSPCRPTTDCRKSALCSRPASLAGTPLVTPVRRSIRCRK